MSLKEAIASVLAAEGGPLHAKDITARALEQGLWETAGETPAATVSATLYSDIKGKGAASRFIQTGKNTFALNPEATNEAVDVPAAVADMMPAVAAVPEAIAVAEPAPAEDNEPKKRLSFVDAAADVLQRHGKAQPMHYRDITQHVLEEGLVKTSGKTPEATLYAQIITENSRAEKKGKPVRFIRHGKGMVSLAASLEPGVQQEIAKHNAESEEQMLQQLRELDPSEFEQLIGELLRALGITDVEVTAYHGDKGIDATGVYELARGLEVRIAVQAKRQQQNVGRPVVQSLNGSIKPHQQGLIITSSDFASSAKTEAARDDKPLVWLINGKQLVKLLIANDIGARRVAVELVEPTGFDLGDSPAED